MTYADGRPAVGKEVTPPGVISGGRGPSEGSVTAKATFGDGIAPVITDNNGEVIGNFITGNRLEETVVGWSSGANNQGKPQVGIAQAWNDIQEGNGSGHQWDFDPYFDFGVSLPITYNMAYARGNNQLLVPITQHHLQFEVTSYIAQIWDPNSGADEDEDGLPDGEYVQLPFEKGDAGFNAILRQDEEKRRNELITWIPDTVTSSTGQYTTAVKVDYDRLCVIESMGFSVYDNDAFDSQGNTDE